MVGMAGMVGMVEIDEIDERKIIVEKHIFYKKINDAYGQIINDNNFLRGLDLYRSLIEMVNGSKNLKQSSDVRSSMKSLENTLDISYKKIKGVLEK